jgi:GAF domain-containing protein
MAMHGRRLDALWKLSNNTALSEDDMTRALLTIAAAALRPGCAFSAHLMRVNGDRLCPEEAVSRGPHATWLGGGGASIALASSLVRDVARLGGTHACADIAADPLLAHLDAGDAGHAGSYIASAFRAGETRFVVALISTQAFATPFDHDDVHFVEALATLLATRLERRLQRERIRARWAS